MPEGVPRELVGVLVGALMFVLELGVEAIV